MAARQVRVLVVEDSEDDTQLAMRMLRQGGFAPEYQRVQDFQALREALVASDWDAVLCDFRMPGFSGGQALDVFRNADVDIPFIFLSGTIGEETAVAAMKAGASDYIMKGNMARLAPVLSRELEQARIRAAHRKAQQELEKTRDLYIDLYEWAPVGYLSLDERGMVVQINQTGAQMLGGHRDGVLGTYFFAFVHSTDTERWNEKFVSILAHPANQRFELSLQGRGGTALHVQLDCTCVRAGDAEPRIRIAMTDITDRKTAEADLRRFEEQMREMQKMESIGTLAGGIAHDFNNILGAILGNVAIAMDEIGADHSSQACLAEIHKASLRARDLVHQILTFSRRREPQALATLHLQPVIEETHRLLRATLPARVELAVALADEPLFAMADSTQMQQVLMNLCTNAWHALKGTAGRICIGLGSVMLDLPAAQRLGGVPPGPYLHLWVNDNGIGMDATTRSRIFEPFFTTKPVGQGTGLGLSVVHGILTAHHGAITVETAVGEGTTFHLYLPKVLKDDSHQAESARQPAVGQGHGERVLYVDDDPTMVVMVERLLQRYGYHVEVFLEPDKAIEAVRDHGQVIDFVVTDFNMPECSGLDVAQAVIRIRPDMPVVISSGFITDDLREQARRAGVRGLLEKENTFQELAGLIASLMQTAHGQQEKGQATA
jgi:PAS domain S-box-containing protein